jgi:hypothetical protein
MLFFGIADAGEVSPQHPAMRAIGEIILEEADHPGGLNERNHGVDITAGPPALAESIRAKSWMIAVLPRAAQTALQQGSSA